MYRNRNHVMGKGHKIERFSTRKEIFSIFQFFSNSKYQFSQIFKKSDRQVPPLLDDQALLPILRLNKFHSITPNKNNFNTITRYQHSSKNYFNSFRQSTLLCLPLRWKKCTNFHICGEFTFAKEFQNEKKKKTTSKQHLHALIFFIYLISNTCSIVVEKGK